MSAEVRVHVRLGSLRLDYEGTQSFYESKVEGLVAAAAAKGARGMTLPSALTTGSHRSNGAPAEGTPSPASATTPASGYAAVSAAPTTAEPAGFAPKSSDFGRYLRRLGPEAGEPDRQVVALAFYLWNYERRETFGRREIEGCFRALGLPTPPGLDEIFVDLTDRKRFFEAAGAAAYRLSKKGENYVKTRLLAS